MSKEALMGLFRHLLTFGGGFLTERGVATGEERQTGVGAGGTLNGLGWGVLNKRNK